ncbi:hypothetical protein ACN4EG_13785 [Alkalinema pantanalense CENA528]|uniref:hypothetical protein n=1 Tax=Alkalinema pantanalense TaxID=1620705 RepID=UPI003D6F3380
MTIQQADYEELLATYSQNCEAIALLRRYRPYLELIPSMRRPEDSLITIPLPIAKLRYTQPSPSGHGNITRAEAVPVPCEIAILMCDPEWKVKTGREIFVFIHRPEEDFSELLGRWRQTQVLLSKDYEWLMPLKYQHILNDGAEKIYPLFVLFEQSPERLRRGLKGANLPCVIASRTDQEETDTETSSQETLETPPYNRLED